MKQSVHFPPIFLCLAALFLLQWVGCTGDESKVIPDISEIQVETKIRHFDKDLFAIDTNDVAVGLAKIKESYPVFSPLFFNDILGANDKRIVPEGEEAYITGFLKNEQVKKLYDTCQIVFADFSDMKAEFEQAFKFYKYHFPDKPTPDVTTFFSEYGYAGFIYGENSLAVGLDFYLGHDYPYQRYNPNNANFSAYLVRSFNKEHLVARTLSALTDDLVGLPKGNRMLDIMVHNGKKRYLLEQLIPYASDTVIHEYTPKQLNWVEENESQVWALFLTEDFLYSSRQKDIQKYVNPSPNSPGMPKEAPGNVGSWMGYQIVKQYMRRFPNKSLAQLISEKDAQKLLQGAKYKPKR